MLLKFCDSAGVEKGRDKCKIFNNVCYVGLYRFNVFDYGADIVTIETGLNGPKT